MDNFARIETAEYYDYRKRSEYIHFLSGLGDKIRFEDDTWNCCHKKRGFAEEKAKTSIYFKNIPRRWGETVRYFAIIRLAAGISVCTVKGNVSGISTFLRYLSEKYPSFDLEQCNIAVANGFRLYLDSGEYSNSAKETVWSAVNIFFRVMKDWNGINLHNPFATAPYSHSGKLDHKYIPEGVALKLDSVFKSEDIRLHLRCAYWILRLIPSRISEVTGMELNCLKRWGDHYVLFIPTWKQNGGHAEPVSRAIHLEDTGVSAYLIGLIKEQQLQSEKLQSNMPDDKKNALFTYQRSCFVHGITHYSNKFYAVSSIAVLNNFKQICLRHNVLDENAQPYSLTTHQFRHNGITDRLEAGFTAAEIAEMTDHHGDAMIYSSYAHFNLKPETIIQKQKYVLNIPDDKENTYTLFSGRILGMEDQLEKRLLKNIRAHRVRGGICSDITGCKCDMWNCLECNFFVPDMEQLGYFTEQASAWREKARIFQAYPMIKSNALRNVELFEKIVKQITGKGANSNE